jgi:hypothetical protein
MKNVCVCGNMKTKESKHCYRCAAKLKMTKEIREKISKSHIGIKHTEETKKKLSEYNKKHSYFLGKLNPRKGKTLIEVYGKEKAEEITRNNIEKHMGSRNSFFGKSPTEEHRNKIRQKRLGKNFGIIGEKHGMYGRILDKNPAWLGGLSFEPYCPKFNKEFKGMIRKRDNYQCFNCGMSEQNHIISKGQVLTVHHIDYNKKNTTEYNCCTLCNKCHIKTNIEREYWTSFFRNKINKMVIYNGWR